MANSWRLQGTYMESCNCDTACPCVFLSDPTQGACTVLLAWHVDSGTFDGVDLAGLNVAALIHSPGNMAKVPWKAALYFDARADETQLDALKAIYTGQAGGHPAQLAEHIGEVLGATQAPIAYEARDGHRQVKIGDVGELAVAAMEGQGGGRVTVAGHPLAIAPGEPAVVGRSQNLRFHDHGYDLQLSEKTAFFSPFTYHNR